MRFRANGSMSIPIALRFSLRAASIVVPQPAKGSRTISPGLEEALKTSCTDACIAFTTSTVGHTESHACGVQVRPHTEARETEAGKVPFGSNNRCQYKS